MNMTEIFTPSILLSETHYPRCFEKGVIVEAISKVSEDGFYGGVEICTVKELSERKKINEIVKSCGLKLNQWMTFVLAEENLDVSSIDNNLRIHSVKRIKEHISQAAECGAYAISLISGPDPEEDKRKDAKDALYESLCELCEEAESYKSINVLLEPLDRGAHKNRLIGPTKEAVELIERVKKSHMNVGLSWDSAHAALCGDDIFESLKTAKEQIIQMHLSNAVMDRKSPDFGDHHMYMGEPGFLTVTTVAKLFKTALDIGLFNGKKPCVSLEVRTPEGKDPWDTEKHGRKVLLDAWKLVEEGEVYSQ